MSKPSYFFASDGAWLSEQQQRFRPSFDGSGFDSSGPSADAALCNQGQQGFDLHFVGRQAALASRQPQLHAVFEAQLAWQNVRPFGSSLAIRSTTRSNTSAAVRLRL